MIRKSISNKNKIHFIICVLLIAQIIFDYKISWAYDNTEITTAKRKMITESISSYSGNCACPYNSAVNGSSCGKRSAYSKPGGAAPLCYETEITDAQAAEWLRRNKR
jgi:ferredoxin-fold anticodon binding domain-containing protein